MVSQVNPRELYEGWWEPPHHEPIAEIRIKIRRTLAVLFRLGDVVELRAFKDRWTKSGYFEEHDVLADEAVKLDGQGWQVYVTLNPVQRALLARAANRAKDKPAVTTSDRDVASRRWLLLDVDPVRPSGVSATDEEKDAAYLTAKEVLQYLRQQGWPDPVIADSGNGFHFLYPIDLPNNERSRELVKGVLEALAFMFDDEKVKIDTSVHNAARIVRLYGTTTRKGDHLPERPHRRSETLKIPKEVWGWE
jgi:hypothetical protein